MSEKEFELYLSLLSRFLRLRPGQREEIADELRDHLEERLEELTRQGHSRDDAIRVALDEFGDAAHLAGHFTQIANRRRRRLIMRCTLGSMAAVVAAVLIGSALWPEMPAVNVPPRAVAQQETRKKDTSRGPRDVPKKSATGRAASPDKAKQYAEIEAKLDTRIELKFQDTPLTDALAFIADSIKVDILINEASLNDEGVKVDAPVTLALKHTTVTAKTALELVLERAAGDSLAYRIRDGLIYVETAAKIEEILEVQVYNCRDLLQGGPENVGAAETMRGYGPGMPGMMPGGMRMDVMKPSMRRGGRSTPKRVVTGEALIEVIMSATSGPWEEDEGTGGTVAEFDGLLIVRQTQRVHREIKQVLEMMRAADKQFPGGKKAAGRNRPRIRGSAAPAIEAPLFADPLSPPRR